MESLIQRYNEMLLAGKTKSSVARVIGKENPTLTRAEGIRLLRNSLSLSDAAASTYFYNYVKENKLRFSTKFEFLQLPPVMKLVDVLSRLIGGEDFTHRYIKWSCESLPDAKHHYFWHGDFDENKRQTDSLSTGIKRACKSGNEHDALYWSIKILNWGRVYRECITYILELYESRTLCGKLRDAIAIMDGEHYDLSRFDQKDLRMDSGLTKVYSFGSKRSIIYDSRVSAALFLIAVKYLSPADVEELESICVLAGGSAQSKTKADKRKRVANKTSQIILKPYIKSKKFPLQAHLNLVANWILQEAIERAYIDGDLVSLWGVSSKSELLRAVESALFMIGADISS